MLSFSNAIVSEGKADGVRGTGLLLRVPLLREAGAAWRNGWYANR
jgi:hypothetical protein